MTLRVVVKLIISAVVASNIGYTAFLLPVLHLVKLKEVPLNLANVLAFIIVSTVFGLIMALITSLLLKKLNLLASISVTVVAFWCAYWLPLIAVAGIADVRVLILDGVAALILWITMILMYRLLSLFI